MKSQRHIEALRHLWDAAELLGDDSEAEHVKHIARAVRIRAVIAEATIIVELPIGAKKPERFTVRQDPTTRAVTLIDRQSGEKRVVDILTLAADGPEVAWGRAG